MPHVDLENLVSACAGGWNDNKIACETLAESSTNDDTKENDVIPYENGATTDPDFPPESFWLSKDAEYDWFDRLTFYERKDSTKGNLNSANLNPNTNHNSNSNSQRFSVNFKCKAAIIGLPKTQKTTYLDSKRRSYNPANTRLFPKRPEPVGKSTVPVPEPGSPKVSCMGRVRSKRVRRRSNSLKKKEKQMKRSRSGGEKQKTGFYSKVVSMFRSKKCRKKQSRSGSRKLEEAVVVERRRETVSSKVGELPLGGEAPALGGVKRFASGRRSGSWTSEDFDQAIGGSIYSDRHGGPMSRS